MHIMNETKSITREIDELKELIYRTYYLYINSTNIVIKAECEERLQKLFIHKSELEHLVMAVHYIARKKKDIESETMRLSSITEGRTVY